MGYKRYEKYKDSGMRWIGEIPEHWRVIKLKWLLKSLESGKREIDENNDFNNEVLSIGGEHIGWQGELILNNCRYISFKFYSSLRQGKIKENDILLVKDGATIGKCAFISNNIPYPAAVNEHVFILRTLQNINPKFVFYLIQSDVGQKQIMLQIRGAAQPGLSSDFKSNLILTLPPLNEQTAIANFLDQKTAEIDSLIADKEKLIQLLQEKRQAIISEAVTKGLDRNVPMKDSGVEWIGEIPEHWEVKKLKFITRIFYGDSLPIENREEGDINVFGSNGIIGTHDMPNTLSPAIIIGRKGSFGKVTFSERECFAIDTTYFIDRRATKTNLKWLFYLLQLLELDKNSQDTGVPGLSREYAYNLYAILPYSEEQTAIANFLDQKTAEIDSLISDIQTQIAKLKEYRQSLIYEAVTGKIDVRDFTSNTEGVVLDAQNTN